MNKTIIININGMVFHIEEDAYEVLKNYMTDVKRHFSTSADSLEITTDIENRIAEMFNEILASEAKQVIVDGDVKKIIEQMGSVQDFETAENDAKDPSNPFASYNTERRRLFRDPDDHLVSGVCAGIANYFDISTVWVRLAFTIMVPFAAIGLFIYIILWMVVPKAVTRADRMAMKGEKQDLKGFKKNFEEELSTVRENLHNFKHEAKPLIYQLRDLLSDIFEHLGAFLKGTGSILGKIIAAGVLIATFGMAVALIISIIALFAAGNMGIYNIFPFNIANHQANSIFIIAGFLLLGIPLLTIILITIGFLFKKASFSRSIGTTLLCIWLASMGAIAYYGFKTAANFREGGRFTQTIKLKPTANNVYCLQLNDTKFLSNEDSTRLRINERFKGTIILDDDFNGSDGPYHNVNIDIEKSDVLQPILVETFSARGVDEEEALNNARSAMYRFEQKDSVLNFDRHLSTPKGFLWRGQEVHLTLKLPVNAKVVIDDKLHRNMNLNLYQCKANNNNEQGSTATFIMTANGLECKIDPVVAARLKADSLKAAAADSANFENQ
ncbi:phage shock protein C (PspC) family protein [Mucilaginibacter oryzae]|uniref:Phage shock protein C (PspC) family protein n=1 Tax=Mucilaginibacter oryzae TaxID=468058 RepID=A0A316H261_9SPHI|nr:PspC domain-containing protein [Mucilaginibacter oryzae]PWK72976.1 phage shock protein C (PspC) family protein [Mucilaginibacter oryzae]